MTFQRIAQTFDSHPSSSPFLLLLSLLLWTWGWWRRYSTICTGCSTRVDLAIASTANQATLCELMPLSNRRIDNVGRTTPRDNVPIQCQIGVLFKVFNAFLHSGSNVGIVAIVAIVVALIIAFRFHRGEWWWLQCVFYRRSYEHMIFGMLYEMMNEGAIRIWARVVPKQAWRM